MMRLGWMCHGASLGQIGAWELRAVPSKLELDREAKRKVAFPSELVWPEVRELMGAPEVLCSLWVNAANTNVVIVPQQ